jgi:hypothetical protein
MMIADAATIAAIGNGSGTVTMTTIVTAEIVATIDAILVTDAMPMYDAVMTMPSLIPLTSDDPLLSRARGRRHRAATSVVVEAIQTLYRNAGEEQNTVQDGKEGLGIPEVTIETMNIAIFAVLHRGGGRRPQW